eukprot:768681-Hanusia_phi.AAC.14
MGWSWGHRVLGRGLERTSARARASSARRGSGCEWVGWEVTPNHRGKCGAGEYCIAACSPSSPSPPSPPTSPPPSKWISEMLLPGQCPLFSVFLCVLLCYERRRFTFNFRNARQCDATYCMEEQGICMWNSEYCMVEQGILYGETVNIVWRNSA